MFFFVAMTSGTSEKAPRVRFVDVADEAGLDAPNVWGGVEKKTYIIEAKGSGLGFIDYDGDGWLDIFMTNGSRFGEPPGEEAPHSRLYRNQRDGTFEDVTASSGMGRSGWLTGVCVGDFDGDGWDDLYSTEWGKNILYRNREGRSFEDVTRRSGLLEEETHWSSGCTFLDYDLDGDLDLFVAGYIDLELDRVPAPGQASGCTWKGLPVVCGPVGLPGERSFLYRNDGGRFSDVTGSSGIGAVSTAYAITAVSNDFNNDGFPDIYVAVDSEASRLFINQGDGSFEEEGVFSGCALSENGQEQAGMGVGVADFNRDGWLDIFKTNFQHDACNLYQNNGDGTFRDIGSLAGIGVNTSTVNWGAGFIDFDNDGWVDIFHVTGHVYPEAERSNLRIPLKTPRIAYRNLGNGRFEDVSGRLGPGVQQAFASRGCAFGDYDNDGDVDVLVLNMNDPPSLLRNDGGNQGNWIMFKLVGTRSNRSAIGSRVRVESDGEVQMNEVSSGGSVMSQNDLRLHFGLGRKTKVDRVSVFWPASGRTEEFEDLEANRLYVVREGEGILP